MFAVIDVEFTTTDELVVTRGFGTPLSSHCATDPGSNPEPVIDTSSVMFCGADEGNVDLTVGPDLVVLAERTERSFAGTVGSVHDPIDTIASSKAAKQRRGFIA